MALNGTGRSEANFYRSVRPTVPVRAPDVYGVEDLGPGLAHFYAWQHGMGCHKKLPKAQELLQMPGRGNLDFTPIVRALKQINFNGFTSIFMHPVPRGIPILEDAVACTAEINRARAYLDKYLERS